jgi:hypothetical protein
LSDAENSLIEKTIHDVVIRRLPIEGSVLTLFRYSDHLLPRIGLIEYIQGKPGGSHQLRLRENSDEVWCLLDGNCRFVWQDERQASPSHGVVQRYEADVPTMLLAPFGVAFGYLANRPCQLVRIAAFGDERQSGNGQIFPWPEK